MPHRVLDVLVGRAAGEAAAALQELAVGQQEVLADGVLRVTLRHRSGSRRRERHDRACLRQTHCNGGLAKGRGPCCWACPVEPALILLTRL